MCSAYIHIHTAYNIGTTHATAAAAAAVSSSRRSYVYIFLLPHARMYIRVRMHITRVWNSYIRVACVQGKFAGIGSTARVGMRRRPTTSACNSTVKEIAAGARNAHTHTHI